MSTKIINLFGGPGTGKSTMAAKLYVQMKMSSLNIELAREAAKDFVWEGSTQFLTVTEYKLFNFAHQYKRIIDLYGKVDYIISDSPLLLYAFYSSEWYELVQFIRHCNSKFNNVNLFVDRSKRVFVEAGRLHIKEEAIQIDKDVEIMLNEMNEPFYRVGIEDDVMSYVL